MTTQPDPSTSTPESTVATMGVPAIAEAPVKDAAGGPTAPVPPDLGTPATTGLPTYDATGAMPSGYPATPSGGDSNPTTGGSSYPTAGGDPYSVTGRGLYPTAGGDPYSVTGGHSYRSTGAGPYGPETRWHARPPAPDYRMRRSATDKMLAGVCGGIAEHTDIDPVYIRLAFLVSMFWGGIGIFAYIAAALIMPKPRPSSP